MANEALTPDAVYAKIYFTSINGEKGTEGWKKLYIPTTRLVEQLRDGELPSVAGITYTLDVSADITHYDFKDDITSSAIGVDEENSYYLLDTDSPYRIKIKYSNLNAESNRIDVRLFGKSGDEVFGFGNSFGPDSTTLVTGIYLCLYSSLGTAYYQNDNRYIAGFYVVSAIYYTDSSKTEVKGNYNFVSPLLVNRWAYNPTLEDAQSKFNDWISSGDNNFSDSTDPYNNGGTGSGQSSGGGGSGDFDSSSDNIPVPNLPSVSANDTGFVGLFTPSLAQLKNLANYMWSDLFSLDSFKKIFADPMDCILGLSIVPVAVPYSATKDVKVGNISTGISMNVANTQYVSVNCGSLSINEFWGAFLDYSPHTKIEIYLPYIGVRSLDTDEIMGKTIQVIYHVDILTGAATAFIMSGNAVLYTFVGACASQIPVSGQDFREMYQAIISVAASAVAVAATAGAAAPVTATGAVGMSTANTGAVALSAGANMANMKPSVEHSGSVSGSGGLLAIQYPYLIAKRPNQCLPANQNKFTGYPSYITETLGNLSGFTEVCYINPSGITGTDSEISEIVEKLKQGVIV